MWGCVIYHANLNKFFGFRFRLTEGIAVADKVEVDIGSLGDSGPEIQLPQSKDVGSVGPGARMHGNSTVTRTVKYSNVENVSKILKSSFL